MHLSRNRLVNGKDLSWLDGCLFRTSLTLNFGREVRVTQTLLRKTPLSIIFRFCGGDCSRDGVLHILQGTNHLKKTVKLAKHTAHMTSCKNAHRRHVFVSSFHFSCVAQAPLQRADGNLPFVCGWFGVVLSYQHVTGETERLQLRNSAT